MYLQTMTLKNAIRLLAFKKNSRISNYSKSLKLRGALAYGFFFVLIAAKAQKPHSISFKI